MKPISAAEQNSGIGAAAPFPVKEDRYRTLFDLAPVAVYSCDASGVILEYNERAAELWGRRPKVGDRDERFCGSFRMYRPDGSSMAHEQCPMGDVLTGKVPEVRNGEVHMERPDHSRVIVLVNIAPIKNEEGKITGAINCFNDVTERRGMENALRDSEARLRRANEELESLVQSRTAMLRHLSVRLMRVQDEEHRRIARDLHDSLGQDLAIAKMNLEQVKRSGTTQQEPFLSAALESIERSLAETRTISFLLHPPLLDEVGFASAARWYADEFARRSGIEVQLKLQEGADRLPSSVEIALFRILQESLTNVHRHSGSKSVEISLSVSEKQAVLTVHDFGRGMPPEFVKRSGPNGSLAGVGLNGMRERVTDLGGSFAIQSSSEGTAITAALPISKELSVESRPFGQKSAA